MTIEPKPHVGGKPLRYPFFDVANGTPFPVSREDVLRCRSAACHWSKRHGVRLLVRRKGSQHICERVD